MTHSFPLGVDVRLVQVGVRVDSGQLDAVGLGDLQDLVMDADGGHALLVGLGQSGFELVVSGDQTLESRKTRGRKRLIFAQTFFKNQYFSFREVRLSFFICFLVKCTT